MQKTNLLDNSTSKILYREDIINEFVRPIFDNRFYRNKQILINKAQLVEFDKDYWVCYPQRFCLDQYGEFEYYRIILLVNNIGSYVQFRPEYIKNRMIITPNAEYIQKIMQLEM